MLHSPVTFISFLQKFCVCTLALKEQNWPLSCCQMSSSLIDMVVYFFGGTCDLWARRAASDSRSFASRCSARRRRRVWCSGLDCCRRAAVALLALQRCWES